MLQSYISVVMSVAKDEELGSFYNLIVCVCVYKVVVQFTLIPTVYKKSHDCSTLLPGLNSTSF